MKKGDIILVPFLFTDLSGTKNRPALVLITSVYGVTVCFITSQTASHEDFDIIVTPSEENGIKKKSIIRLRKITTLDLNLVLGKIGNLSASDLVSVNQSLKKMLLLD